MNKRFRPAGFIPTKFRALAWALGFAPLILLGCGAELPEMGVVSGVITMKNKPLPGVKVVFSPDPSAGPVAKSSRGITDEQGRYVLTYRSAEGVQAEGAAIGEHVVTVVDFRHIESRDKPLPYRFSLGLAKAGQSPLRASVKAGSQTIDFDLSKFPNR